MVLVRSSASARGPSWEAAQPRVSMGRWRARAHLNPSDLITKLQSFVYVLRRGQKEQVLAALALSLFSCAVYLRQEWKEVPFGWAAKKG